MQNHTKNNKKLYSVIARSVLILCGSLFLAIAIRASEEAPPSQCTARTDQANSSVDTSMLGRIPALERVFSARLPQITEQGPQVTRAAQQEEEDAVMITPLMMAAQNGCVPGVYQLLKNGAHVNVKGMFGTTALHAAVTGANLTGSFSTGSPHFDVVKTLLGENAHPDLQDEIGKSPLMLASQWPLHNIAHLLVQHGATVNLTDNRGQTALFYAANVGNKKNMELLFQHNATPLPTDQVNILSQRSRKVYQEVLTTAR